MNIVEFFRMDENNPGDWYSNPCRYFFPDQLTQKLDIDKIRKTNWNQTDAIIAGGGGLIGNENFETFMFRISTHPDEIILRDILETKIKDVSIENRDQLSEWKQKIRRITVDVLNKIDRSVGPRILWGAGHNSRDITADSYSIDYPPYLDKFHLIGIRDWGTEFRWVPCASCMHPAFDKEYEIKNEFVWFEHKKRLIDTKSLDVIPSPRMLNTGQNIDQIIEFLGSANTVITNSYHGVYWATLLGRRVVCIPWSSKFNMFKHPPTMAADKNWHEKIGEAKSYPNALEECRNANIEFHKDVLDLLKEKEIEEDSE